MDAKKPMKILNFPVRPRTPPPVRRSLASIENLLEECRGRQVSLRQEGRRLRESLDRLSLLTEDVIRGSERLRQALGRLRAFQAGARPEGPRD
jgi:hypothetical protein